MADPLTNGWILPRRVERLRFVAERRLHHLVVVLDNLQDPHNASAVLRSCDVFGVQNVVVLERDRTFAVSTGVSHGCERWLTIERPESPEQALSRLKAEGFRLWSADPAEDAISLYDLDCGGRLALVFGNETHGVAAATRPYCDGRFVIPMAGFSRSLNVSVAAAVSLAHVCRMRRDALGGRLSDDPEKSKELFRLWVERELERKSRPH